VIDGNLEHGEELETCLSYGALSLEVVGVLAVLAGTVISLVRYGIEVRSGRGDPYHDLRHRLGKAILFGLEILMSADILATFVATISIHRVVSLDGIVLIRTVLSPYPAVKVEGRFPWQRGTTDT